MKIELVYAPGCPNVEAVRARLTSALEVLGLADMPVTDRIDVDHPSPSVLTDGVDVMGEPIGTTPACRLDLPTTERLISVLSRAGT